MYYYRNRGRCHWCNTALTGKQERFCSKICKAAHHRAYKKYVTEVARQAKSPGKIGNARGKVKKKKALTKP